MRRAAWHLRRDRGSEGEYFHICDSELGTGGNVAVEG